MPHIRVEYSEEQFDATDRKQLLESVFNEVARSGLFETSHIRVRLLPVSDYKLGSLQQGFIHMECRIHHGRSMQQRKALADNLVATVERSGMPVSSITCEVIEMLRETYARSVVKE